MVNSLDNVGAQNHVPFTTMENRAGLPAKPGTLKEAASGFAAIFCKKLLSHAWNAQGFLSGGKEIEPLYDRLNWEYSRIITKREGFGITGMIVDALGGPERAEGKDSGPGKEDVEL